MANTASHTDLFRFVALRPVETVSKDRETLRCMRSRSADNPATPLMTRLHDATTWAAKQKAARDFILSQEYLGDETRTDKTLVALRGIFQVLSAAAEKRQLTGLPERVKDLQKQLGKTADELRGVEDKLWDSLTAAYVSPRVLGHDRAEFIECLRALHYGANQDRVRTADDLVRVTRAAAFVPAWVTQKNASAPSPPPPQPSPGKTFTPKTSEQVSAIRKDILSIDSALDDFEFNLASSRAPKSIPAASAAAGKTAVTRTEPPWTSSAALRPSLQPSTIAALDGLDRTWPFKAPDEVVDNLDLARGKATTKAQQVGGNAAISGLKTRTTPAARSLNPNLADFDTSPVLTEPAVFTGSIVGSVGTVRPAGIGDLLVVKDTLLGYEETEIASIENILGTETKNRVYRKLDRTSQTTVSSTATSETTERDLQTTQRYELQSESARTLDSDVAIDTGLNISASYGPVLQVDTSADFSVENSSETSSSTSSDFAQDVVDKSVSKLTQSIKEEITTKVLSEIEETSTHGFTNTGTANVVGIYRWLDKSYQGQVYNYGKRLMMEFIVPEPSAFYKFAQDNLLATDPTLQPPVPLEADFSFQDLEPGTYHRWVDRYQVEGVSPPPPKSRVIGKVIELPTTVAEIKNNDPNLLTTRSDSLALPAGYLAKEAWVGDVSAVGREGDSLQIGIGRHWLDVTLGQFSTPLDNEETAVPLGVFAVNRLNAVIHIEVRCERSNETLRAWQLATFEKIVDAYNAQQSAYDSKRKSKESAQASTLTSIPPETKRAIEMGELKKGCLELLTNQYFHDFDATLAGASPFGYPEFRVSQAMIEGPYTQFFEQCFEWDQITYIFYPYFWGRKSEWVSNSCEADGDPIFQSFLQSGAARVQVPVRRKYEFTFFYYLSTGEIWNGGEPPILDDRLYVSIVDEIESAEDTSLEDATPYGDPWTYTLPTTLVILQPDATLPSWPAT